MTEREVFNNGNSDDNEIISSIKVGNYELLQVIIDRYYSTILFYINKYCPASCREDAVQEATLALFSAVKDFDSSKSSFSTFANLCIKRSVIGVLKSLKAQKNIPDDMISSIDDIDLIDSNSPEKIFFDREDYNNLTDSIKLELSSLEYDVLQLYLSGEKYSGISKKLNISEKSVDNSLSRIRKKLKR